MHVEEETKRYPQMIRVMQAGKIVRNFKSQWGSCDRKGQVVFNWNIVKASHAAIDDEVIHEPCHLIHANHSDKYWKEVAKHDKEYKAHRKWLREVWMQLLSRHQ